MAVEQLQQPPDSDPVAIFTLGHRRHVLGKGGVRRWRAMARTLMRFTGCKIFRPHFPWHDEGDGDLGLVRPRDWLRSWHSCPRIIPPQRSSTIGSRTVKDVVRHIAKGRRGSLLRP